MPVLGELEVEVALIQPEETYLIIEDRVMVFLGVEVMQLFHMHMVREEEVEDIMEEQQELQLQIIQMDGLQEEVVGLRGLGLI